MNAERIEEIIARVQREISGVNLIVLDLVRGASMAGESITQREIAKSKLWAKYQGAGGIDSDLRHIRAIIRTLRLAHGIPIISGRQGYRLPGGEDEAKAYLKRMEKEAKARAWASLETYRGMSKILGTKSEYFEGMEKLHKQLELFGKKPVATLTVSRAKSPCSKCGGSGVINGSRTGAHGDQCSLCKGSGLTYDNEATA